ncbi:MAG: hypothetical protein DHS80DRAFT_26409 [Piptocephalis tieghemiana]|nr:MAG: hypothetical protein DHS80DRAFT_26409 [Piptocephalis tieghemiana]
MLDTVIGKAKPIHARALASMYRVALIRATGHPKPHAGQMCRITLWYTLLPAMTTRKFQGMGLVNHLLEEASQAYESRFCLGLIRTIFGFTTLRTDNPDHYRWIHRMFMTIRKCLYDRGSPGPSQEKYVRGWMQVLWELIQLAPGIGKSLWKHLPDHLREQIENMDEWEADEDEFEEDYGSFIDLEEGVHGLTDDGWGFSGELEEDDKFAKLCSQSTPDLRPPRPAKPRFAERHWLHRSAVMQSQCQVSAKEPEMAHCLEMIRNGQQPDLVALEQLRLALEGRQSPKAPNARKDNGNQSIPITSEIPKATDWEDHDWAPQHVQSTSLVKAARVYRPSNGFSTLNCIQEEEEEEEEEKEEGEYDLVEIHIDREENIESMIDHISRRDKGEEKLSKLMILDGVEEVMDLVELSDASSNDSTSISDGDEWEQESPDIVTKGELEICGLPSPTVTMITPLLDDSQQQLTLLTEESQSTKGKNLFPSQPVEYSIAWHPFSIDNMEPLCGRHTTLAKHNMHLQPRRSSSTGQNQRKHQTEIIISDISHAAIGWCYSICNLV